MSDILKQIQELQEQFSNLFEVEGLGDPSGDVPPSTNKLKRDVKTKDGKVELVSVENELFPYEGDKKSQFQQKVIDTINGMIQGTKTLEDLLQVVRSKQVKSVKEGFEGAIELLEDLYNYIKKKHGEPKYAGIDSHPANKSAKLIHKMSDAKGKEYAQEKEKNPDINLYNKRYTTKNTMGEQKTQNRSSEYRKFSDDWRLPKTDDEKITASIRRNKLKPVVSRRTNGGANESFEQAISILEKLISEEKTSTNDYHEKKANFKKAVEKKHPDVLKLYSTGTDPYAEQKRNKLEGSFEKAQDKQYQQEMKRGIGKGRLWNPTKNDKGDYKTRERSQINPETGGFNYKSHEDTVKGSQRRNAEKSIKQLDSKIKKAAKEFNELYIKKQTNPNIDLHPAAHKEGNLRIERDKQKERLSSLKEAIEILEGLFVNDGRGDLIADMTGTKGSTGIQQIRSVASTLGKMLGDAKKKREKEEKEAQKQAEKAKKEAEKARKNAQKKS